MEPLESSSQSGALMPPLQTTGLPVSCVSGGGSLLQAGGAGEEVCRRRRLLVQTFPLPIRVHELLAVSANPEAPQKQTVRFHRQTIHSDSTQMNAIIPLFMQSTRKSPGRQHSSTHRERRVCLSVPDIFTRFTLHQR